MRIKKLQIEKVALGIVKPYTITFKTVDQVENIIVCIELENGVIGYGAGNPSKEVTGESIEETFNSLKAVEEEGVFNGKDIRHFLYLLSEAQVLLAGKPAAMAALDIALHDVFCKYLKIAVVDFYGRKTDGLFTSVTIGIKGVEETLQEAQSYSEMGFKILKIKLGHNLELDIERIAKTREVMGMAVLIRVDVNQGYNEHQTIKFFRATEMYEIELVEQPVPTSQFPIPFLPYKYQRIVAADESLQSPKDAFRLVTHPTGCGIFNIKLMKCGGVANAMRIADMARYGNTKLMWGCNDESIISISAALHAAYANDNTHFIDLDGSFDLASDVVNGGFRLEDGRLYIKEGCGFGFQKV